MQLLYRWVNFKQLSFFFCSCGALNLIIYIFIYLLSFILTKWQILYLKFNGKRNFLSEKEIFSDTYHIYQYIRVCQLHGSSWLFYSSLWGNLLQLVGFQVGILCHTYWTSVLNGWPMLVCPCFGVHKRKSLSLSSRNVLEIFFSHEW